MNDKAAIPMRRYAIILVEEASLISQACLMEPFEFLRRKLGGYAPVLQVCRLGQSPQNNEIVVPPATDQIQELIESFGSRNQPDAVFVCSGADVAPALRPKLRTLVRACTRNNVRLASIGASTWVLAEEQATRNKTYAVHWGSAFAFAERHLSFNVTTQLFEADGTIATCAGELATLDFMIDFLAHEFGEDWASRFCDAVLVSGARSGNSPQPGAQENRLLHYPLLIQKVVRQMCQNLEAPVTTKDLAVSQSISQRQLERLFSRYLACSPRRYYLNLQLERAHQLCQQTSLSLIEISIASGFGSSSVLSRHFKRKFGVTPSQLRK